jgi:AcrR family transcriptional regulator
MDEKQATRDRILHAAITRIMHYGYGKTTMAEIAADCDMSPGNIYRFFEAKIDLAEAMARKHYADEHTGMAAVGRRKETPDKKLKEMFQRKMRENYQMFSENAKILEVAEVLSKERPLFLNELMAQERVILRAVIEEGIANGLFADTDA